MPPHAPPYLSNLALVPWPSQGILTVMNARLDRASDKGCDGVGPDAVEVRNGERMTDAKIITTLTSTIDAIPKTRPLASNASAAPRTTLIQTQTTREPPLADILVEVPYVRSTPN